MLLVGKSRDISEHDLVNDGAHKRLDEIPKRAENRLLVKGNEIAPNRQKQ